MTFSKETYWKNREAHKRGQGEYPNPIVGEDITPPSTFRGLGLRKKRHATKVAASTTEVWTLRKKRIRLAEAAKQRNAEGRQEKAKETNISRHNARVRRAK